MGESAIEGDLLCSLPLLLCFCEAVRRRGEQARARASRRREPEASFTREDGTVQYRTSGKRGPK